MTKKSPNKQQKPKHTPIVFMFRPTKFKWVSGSRIKEWEKLMTERVGIKPDGDMLKIQGGQTTSGCPAADDCDR